MELSNQLEEEMNLLCSRERTGDFNSRAASRSASYRATMTEDEKRQLAAWKQKYSQEEQTTSTASDDAFFSLTSRQRSATVDMFSESSKYKRVS